MPSMNSHSAAIAVVAAAFCLILNIQVATIKASVIISEIAAKGSSNVCSGNDWIELHNNDPNETVSLAGYILHDDKGINHVDAFTFPQDYNKTLGPGEYRLICTMMMNSTVSPQFSIGGDDVITLVSSDGSTVIASVGPLPDTYNEFDITYAWDSDPSTSTSSIERPAEINQTARSFMSGEYNYYYTSTPTPGLPNKLTQVGETADQIKQRLTQQNDEGTHFFGMNAQGLPIEDALDPVLDLHLTMQEDDYQYMMKNKGYEVYLPFQSARLVTADLLAQEEILLLSTPGQIRTKGQSSLYFAACAGTTTVPFQLEFDRLATLFGMERMYLRNHFLDPTYMRDWAMNRMLARFGLPHLRTRKLQFYINNNYIGFYDAVEAVDQEYVFARSFPDYNPFNYALYKRKMEAIGCGQYDPDVLADAEMRLDDPSKPPYHFEPGPHRDPIPIYGRVGLPLCIGAFQQKYYMQDIRDVATLYLKYDRNCGEMLVQEGLMDRDLGTENWDNVMTAFINKYYVTTIISKNSDMDQHVDLESFLKTTAVFAVMLSQDSVLGTTNNYYMAQIGDDKGFKIMAYDHNIAPAKGTMCECGEEKEIHWSISRPTCGALELNPVVGPLLLKPELHALYLEHVREFIQQVAGAPDLLEEITNHARAIHRYVKQDVWHYGNFRVQFSTDPADWKKGLVPFLMARVEDVRQQLEAIDNGSIPRGPHQAVKESNYEQCVDWHSTEAPVVACYNDCLYDGCYKDNWQISHQCNEETGTCLHGTYDLECRGIPEGDQYPGMESPRTSTGLDTFCIDTDGAFPVKASICPPPPPPDQDMYSFDEYNHTVE